MKYPIGIQDFEDLQRMVMHTLIRQTSYTSSQMRANITF